MRGLPAVLAGAFVTMAAVHAPESGQGKGPAAVGAGGLKGQLLWTHEAGG